MKTIQFCQIPIHHLEFILNKYQENKWNIKQVRAGIFHLLDDFGNDIPLKEDWNDESHWLGQYCKGKEE